MLSTFWYLFLWGWLSLYGRQGRWLAWDQVSKVGVWLTDQGQPWDCGTNFAHITHFHKSSGITWWIVPLLMCSWSCVEFRVIRRSLASTGSQTCTNVSGFQKFHGDPLFESSSRSSRPSLNLQPHRDMCMKYGFICVNTSKHFVYFRRCLLFRVWKINWCPIKI
jgi:hypothetical protein